MSESAPTRKRRIRERPRDPAPWLWAAVALFAMVPLRHAVAALPAIGAADHPRSGPTVASQRHEPGVVAPVATRSGAWARVVGRTSAGAV